MKKLLLLYFIFTLSGGSSRLLAQEGIVLQTDYMVENLALVHPGMTGANLAGSRIYMGMRQQWFGIEDAPQTQLLSFETSAFSNTALGVVAYNDLNGSFQRKSLLLTYAYKINLTEEVWNTRRPFPTKNDSAKQLIFGLNLGVFTSDVDQSNFNNSSNDPALGDQLRMGSYTNLNVGVAYISTRLSMQFSAKNFPLSSAPDNRIVAPIIIEKKNFKHFILSGQYRIFLPSEFSVEPSFLVQYFSNKNQLYDLGFKLSKLFRGGRLWGGISYRNNFETPTLEDSRANGNLTFSMLSSAMGINYKNFMVGYQYGNALDVNRISALGHHFLLIGFHF